MSGIYISGMEMPTTGMCKTITIFDDGAVIEGNGSEKLGITVPIPPHGRLGDLDALFKQVTMDEHFSVLEAMYVQSLISNTPTIIPGDKED